MNVRLLPLFLVGFLGTGASGQALRSELNRQQAVWQVRWNDQVILLYTFADTQFKPYVKELRSLAGDNVLVDAPADHLHHHGLMYAIKVNGINFWEETPQSGYEIPVGNPEHNSLTKVVAGTSSGDSTPAENVAQARFAHTIHWVAPGDKPRGQDVSAALLVERRTLVLTVDVPAQEVSLEWQAQFRAGPAAAQVELTGADYHGLGLRFPPDFNGVAVRQNSARLPFSVEANRDVHAAEWNSQTAPLNGRVHTVALFGQPPGVGGTQHFFSMLNPFAYLSVTQALDLEPRRHQRDDTFSLRYLVVVRPGAAEVSDLDRRFAAWRKTFPAGTP